MARDVTEAHCWSQPVSHAMPKGRGPRGLSVKVRCIGVGGGQEGAHSIATGRNRRKTASCRRAADSPVGTKAALARICRFIQARERLPKAARASWWQKKATKSRSRSCGCSKRLWRQRWKTSREAATYHTGCGEDVATLLSLLAAALARDSSNACCRLASGIRT